MGGRGNKSSQQGGGRRAAGGGATPAKKNVPIHEVYRILNQAGYKRSHGGTTVPAKGYRVEQSDSGQHKIYHSLSAAQRNALGEAGSRSTINAALKNYAQELKQNGIAAPKKGKAPNGDPYLIMQ